MQYPTMKVGPLSPERVPEAARLLADAFRDYPAWIAIGPRRARPRWRMVNRFYRGALARARDHGAPLAVSVGDQLRGVAITYPAGRWPPPAASFVQEAWGVALSGPGAAVRGLRCTSAIDAAHPSGPHVFLHTLGVNPDRQRSGAGSALLTHIIAEADDCGVPIHLTTSTAANLPFYRRFGFAITAEERLPRRVPLWAMDRPPGP
jgi:GNAT superfamily N-acetyltransferase